MELHRLEPYFEDADGFPKIQVLNMPHVKLRQVELLGIVRKVLSRSKLDLLSKNSSFGYLSSKMILKVYLIVFQLKFQGSFVPT